MSHKARRDQRFHLNTIWKLSQTRSGEIGLPVQILWYGITLLLLTAVYFGTGHLGLSIGAVGGFATLIWFPSGIAAASVFLWGYRLWPAITLGAFLVNFLTGAHLFVAICISLGNTLEALVCTAILRRGSVQPRLDELHDVLVLVFVAVPLSTLISSTIGVSSLWLGGHLVWPLVSATWSAWWLGDAISLLLLTPLLLTWSLWPHTRCSSKRLLEMGLFSVCLLVIGVLLLLKLSHIGAKGGPMTYLVFLPLIWTALRFGPRSTTMALAVLSSFITVGTLLGAFPFSTSSLDERLFFIQGFMAIMAITALLLAAVTAERRAFEQRKDVFLSMASHELRTPLTALQGYTQLLQMQFAGSDNQRVLHTMAIIVAQTKRLARLIEELLDLSKIQAGKLAFTEETVDMGALVREVAEQLQQTTLRHRITIEGETSGTIIGDRERFAQVLNNLLTNAIKYSPEAECIMIHLTPTAESLTVSVQDFGIGIPSREQEKIFECFYRVAGKREQATSGLGIGLCLAFQIIKHYKGKLWVESVEGQGSTFFFSLPREK
ncbi:MAG TPA: MASE1 domain-containing protein [Ktedonobacteraceae bacterium]|nr:MASE1 domain-containing protein [Ktedonobacteraceae bacterium]